MKKTILIIVAIIAIIGVIASVVCFASCASCRQVMTKPTSTKAKEIAYSDYVFTGNVIEIGEEYVTVSSGALTVSFYKDETTAVSGKLTKGDYVAVVFLGELYEIPYAYSITVLEENKTPTTKNAYGYIAETGKSGFVLAFTSSHYAAIKTNDKTKISGKANKLAVGQEALVVYSGDLEKNAVAVSVEILSVPKKDTVKKMTNTVSAVGKTYFSVKSGNNVYSFNITDKTKFTGVKLAVGVIATVSYTGELGKGPVAKAVFCKKSPYVKPSVKPTKKPTPKPTEKPAPKPTEKPSPKPTKETETPTEEPTEAPTKTIKGYLYGYGTDNVIVFTSETDKVDIVVDEKTDIAAGYQPKDFDRVEVTYNTDTKHADKMKLIERPDIYMTGTIASWDKGSCSITLSDKSIKSFKNKFPGIELADGKTFTAKYGKDLDKLSSYEPKEKDKVNFIVSGDNGVSLLYIRFVSSPEK